MTGSVSRPDVSVVIVTWNSAAVIGGCLRSLRAATEDLSTEVIVVDNCSSDGTVTVAMKAAPEATVLANNTNRGLPAANNQGLGRATAPAILICNPDVRFEPGSVTAMVAALERIPAAGWVVPRLLHEDGSPHESAGELPRLTEVLLGRQWARWRRSGFWHPAATGEHEARIGRGHEAAYVVRRSAVDAVGPQDERYVLDYEGIDWSDRFDRHGWETWLIPQARVVHLGGASIRQVPFRWVVRQHRGMYLYFSDRRPRHWKPVLAVAFAVRAVVKLALTALHVPMYELAHRAKS